MTMTTDLAATLPLAAARGLSFRSRKLAPSSWGPKLLPNTDPESGCYGYAPEFGAMPVRASPDGVAPSTCMPLPTSTEAGGGFALLHVHVATRTFPNSPMALHEPAATAPDIPGTV